MPLTVTVVIPAYNEEETITETIHSLRKQTSPPQRIIVVDDCSSDKTGEIARSLGVEVIRPPKNQGTKAQAQNVALPFIDTDITVTIDADTTLAPNALELLVRPFEKNEKLAVASGYIVPRYRKTFWERGRLVEYLFGLEMYKIAQKDVGSPIVCSGCFSAFRTKILKQHGGFDPGTMAEDMNYTWKALISGDGASFVPEAVCYPVEPPTWDIYRKQVDRWSRSFFQNFKIFWRKFHRRPMLAVFIWTAIFEALIFPLSIIMTAYVIYLAFNDAFQMKWLWSFVGSLGVDLFLVIIFTLIGGVRTGNTSIGLRSIPCYYVLRFINIGFWWRSLYLELIRKEKLSTWQKGH